MKTLLLTTTLSYLLFALNLSGQNIESIRSSLDSLRNEKSVLLEELEELETLESEYDLIISKLSRPKPEKETFYKIKQKVNFYSNSNYNHAIGTLKKGTVVQLVQRQGSHLSVSYKGQEGYVMSYALEKVENPQAKKKPIETELNKTLRLDPISSGEFVQHSYYALSYTEQHEQAKWVFYKLTEGMLRGSSSRTDNFRPDNMIKTSSASLNDYKGSGYDRGHLCPAGDMTTNLAAMSESFLMSNMTPQDPSFNRGIWKSLEATVRNWAVNEKEIYIATGPVFENNLGTIGNGVTIPGSYYKVIYDPTDEEKMIALVLPNRKGEKQLEKYVVNVDYVESITGIDFFSGVPDEVENRLESNSNVDLWEFKGFNASTSGGTAVQCNGIAKSTKKQCRNRTTNENGFCHVHQAQSPGGEKKETERLTSSVQCSGKTQKGARCKNKTLNANGYCHVHQSQVSGTTVKKTTTTSSYSGRCQATTKSGTQCKRKASAGSRYCWQHQ